MQQHFFRSCATLAHRNFFNRVMSFSPLLQQLIDALRCLPGVGQKTAQRMAFQLLERNREGGLKLSEKLKTALTHIVHCQSCRNFSETPICELCTNPKRDDTQLCCAGGVKVLASFKLDNTGDVLDKASMLIVSSK